MVGIELQLPVQLDIDLQSDGLALETRTRIDKFGKTRELRRTFELEQRTAAVIPGYVGGAVPLVERARNARIGGTFVVLAAREEEAGRTKQYTETPKSKKPHS